MLRLFLSLKWMNLCTMLVFSCTRQLVEHYYFKLLVWFFLLIIIVLFYLLLFFVSLFTFRLYFSLWDPKPAHKGNIYRPTPVQWCSPYRFSVYNAGFSIRAGSQQNLPAISCQLFTYYSLEITPQKARI